MDEQKLAEIEARAKAATEQATELDGKFGTFIHHYGKDIPDLIAEVRRLRALYKQSKSFGDNEPKDEMTQVGPWP